MATMKAVMFEDDGNPEVLVLKEAPRSRPGAGRVLVRFHAAAVNPRD